jgi:hypothetical protein
MKFFAAFFALISNLQIFAEQMTFATVRASATKSTHHRLVKRGRFFRAGGRWTDCRPRHRDCLRHLDALLNGSTHILAF